MAKEKVLDVSFQTVEGKAKKRIDKYLHRLHQKHPDYWDKWGVALRWNASQNTLFIRSPMTGVKGSIHLKPERLLGYVEAPFFLFPVKDRLVKELHRMVHEALRGAA